MRLLNQSKQKEICSALKVANTFKTRTVGLIGTTQFTDGLYFPFCNWIHTFFMSIPIDVIYIDKNGVVQKIDESLQPWRLPLPVFKAKDVIELPAGSSRQHQIQVGDQLYVGH